MARHGKELITEQKEMLLSISHQGYSSYKIQEFTGINLRRQTSRSHYGSKVPAVTVTVFKYRNKIGKIVVKAVPYSVT